MHHSLCVFLISLWSEEASSHSLLSPSEPERQAYSQLFLAFSAVLLVPINFPPTTFIDWHAQTRSGNDRRRWSEDEAGTCSKSAAVRYASEALCGAARALTWKDIHIHMARRRGLNDVRTGFRVWPPNGRPRVFSTYRSLIMSTGIISLLRNTNLRMQS